MLAIQATRAGGPDVLEAVDLPTPEPGPGQVRIRHEAIGLNFIDTYQRSGLYPIKMPAVLGQEGAGVVEAVGEGVTRFKIGDRAAYGTGPMAPMPRRASWSHEHRAVQLPDPISADVAAAAMLKGMTAEFLLRRCYPLQAGEATLVRCRGGRRGGILIPMASVLAHRRAGDRHGRLARKRRRWPAPTAATM